MNIHEQIDRIKAEGYNEANAANAEAKLCQDIILQLITKSSLCQNCTIKGDVGHESRKNLHAGRHQMA